MLYDTFRGEIARLPEAYSYFRSSIVVKKEIWTNRRLTPKEALYETSHNMADKKINDDFTTYRNRTDGSGAVFKSVNIFSFYLNKSRPHVRNRNHGASNQR